MEPIHRIHGRVVHADGQPAAGVLVAVADEDCAWVDLLGIGETRASAPSPRPRTSRTGRS